MPGSRGVRLHHLSKLLLAACEDVPGCAEGRVLCVLREGIKPHRIAGPGAFAEGRTDAEAITAARAALARSLSTPAATEVSS